MSLSLPQLSERAIELLVRAGAPGDDQGIVGYFPNLEGLDITASGKTVVSGESSQREQAEWEAAWKELRRKGLIEGKAGGKQASLITAKGWEQYDRFKGRFPTQ